MGFSSEWENVYKSGQHQSRWPWSDVVSFTYRYLKPLEGKRILELGCGDGANIPFFQSVCADYYGIEGSKYQVDKLSERFAKKSVAIIAEDFTQSISFGGEFDLILDRGAITCNTTEGILNTMDLIYDKLKLGGYFLGIDWFSMNHDDFRLCMKTAEKLDEHTFKFHEGYFNGLGSIHCFDHAEIMDLLSQFKIVELTERRNNQQIPEKKTAATWNVVAKKA